MRNPLDSIVHFWYDRDMTVQTKAIHPANERRFRVTGMDCASCAASIETGVSRLDGVDACAISFTTETLSVSGPVAAEIVIARVRELGYDVDDETVGAGLSQAAPGQRPRRELPALH